MTSAYEAGVAPEIRVHHRLRIAREFAGLEQGQLAELTGISRQSISAAESGRTEPRKVTLNAWALATGVPVSWLKTGEGPSNQPGPSDPDDGTTPPTPSSGKCCSSVSAGQLVQLPVASPVTTLPARRRSA